jgi:hypothetical protein
MNRPTHNGFECFGRMEGFTREELFESFMRGFSHGRDELTLGTDTTFTREDLERCGELGREMGRKSISGGRCVLSGKRS